MVARTVAASLLLVTLVAGQPNKVRPADQPTAKTQPAPATSCKKTLIPIDATHTCDVGIPACETCPGKKIEYLPCNGCDCGLESADCAWGEWGPWSECSMGALVDGDCLSCPNCCNGVQMRSRSIKIPATCGGKPCNGSDKEIQACGQDCNAPGCSWTKWSEWSTCSKKCGGGQKYRKRKMVGNKKKTCCNKDLGICDGPSIEWCGCNTQCCGGESGCLCENGGCDCGKCMKGIAEKGVDCAWAKWSEWIGECKATTCGAPGALTRTREIKTFALNGGKPCCGESRMVKPCGAEACGHDCKYSEWTDWSGCTESCGGGQKYRHREIFFTPNGKDQGGKACAPKQDTECPASCYKSQKVEIPGGSCPCIEKKTMLVTCKAPKVASVGTTEVSETAGCHMSDCKCYWKDWTPWSACSKKCGGGYKVRCKMQGCAAEIGNDFGAAAMKAALDPCNAGNKGLPKCGKNGWCVANEWGDATCECDTGSFFIKDATVKNAVKGACVEQSEFDTFIAKKYVVSNEVIQPVKLAGLQGIQVNDAELVLQETSERMLNVPADAVSVHYEDDTHEERVEDSYETAQKLFLADRASRFNIRVRCDSLSRECNSVQMELLGALRDNKNRFNEVFRKRSGKETAYVAAAGLPAVVSLSEGSLFEELEGSGAASGTTALLGLVAGVALATLGLVSFFKLRRRSAPLGCDEPCPTEARAPLE